MKALDIPHRETAPDPLASGGALGCPGSAPRPSRRRRGAGLRSRFVATALLAAGMPVLLTGGLAVYVLADRPEFAATGADPGRNALAEYAGRAGSALPASEAASGLDGFLAARIADARTWASTPVIVEAARAARSGRAADVPAGNPVRAPNDHRAALNAPGPWPGAGSFLHRRLADSPWLARASLTDRDGFTVVSTGPAGAAAPTGERWWRAAWKDGIAVGRIDYGEPAGPWRLGLAVRIEDPRDGAPLGVLKTVLAIEPFGTMAGRAAPPLPDAGVEPAVLVRAEADPAGPGHARIVNASAGVADRNGLPVPAAAAGPTEAPRAGRGPAGEASNAGSFASVLDRLGVGGDLPRSILARIPDAAVLLAGIEDALADRRVRLALALGAIGLLSGLFAALLANTAARRYAAAIRAVTEMAERAARGERAREPAAEAPGEIARLGDAVDRLARLRNRIREPRPVGGAHAQ